jgi:16S rRNA (uracil1498-N3)-methyltransferase
VSSPRLHLDLALAAGATLTLEGDRVHYLRNVLRLREGAQVRAFNAADGEWRARIAGSARHRLDLLVEDRLRAPLAEPGPTLVFAPIRRNRMEWLVEKAVELGAGALVPVLTRRTVVRPENPERLQAIAVEAAEQCERLTVPAVAAPVPLPLWLAARDPSVPLLFAEERGAGAPVLAAVRQYPGAAILVGPEGGFAEDELALLHAAPAATAISLGRLILRAETAALHALVAWQLAQTDA